MSEAISFFIIGSLSTEFLVQSFVETLFYVGQTKRVRRTIRKEYSWIQRYLCTYVKFPLKYNNKTAKFWFVFRFVHYFIVLLMTVYLIAASALTMDDSLFKIVAYTKFFVLDVAVGIYSHIHTPGGFFSYRRGSLDFSKTEAERKAKHKR